MAALPLISEKHLAHSIASDLVAYCDPHDLVAIATDAHDVIVYRINGQVAFTVKRKDSETEITALGWKQDGGVLGVGWGDGTYGLYSGENGRLLSQSSVRVGASGREREWKLDLTPDWGGEDEDEADGAVVTSFQWMRHRPIESTAAAGLELASKLQNLTTEEWYDGVDEEGLSGELANGKLSADGHDSIKRLARSIATMDVTTVLPRLSAIPGHGMRTGPDGSKFASQVATDLAFNSSKETTTEEVDSLVVCSSDGVAHVLTDDTVTIGTCQVKSKPILQAAHPQSACHTVLSQDEGEELYASFIDLPLHKLGGTLLHIIATNTKRIQNLLAYITQTIRCIQHDYTTGLQFPTRVMNNMQTELEEKQEGDLTTNLYHLAMTGNYTETMHEWLTDIVKETNHKRWDQAVNAMYKHIQDHLFINLKPALDRLSIATTELRGQARFYQGRSSKFEVPPELFMKMLDGIDSLRIMSQKMLLVIMTESRQFKAFSKWVRVMIDIGVAGPGSKEADEVEEKENPNLDYPLLLAYIESTMTRSKLARHIEDRPGLKGSAGREAFFGMPQVAEMGYERTVEAVQKLDGVSADEDLTMKGAQDGDALLNLPALTVYLSANIRVALERITDWQGKMLHAPETGALSPLPGGIPNPHVLDMQMTLVDDPAHGEHSTARLLVASGEARRTLVLYPQIHPTAQRSMAMNTDTLADMQGEILDAKFAGPGRAVFLVRDDTGDTAVVPLLLPDGLDGLRIQEKAHSFAANADFTPERLVVGGREGKMVCLVLGNSGREWRALDLDSKPAAAGAEGTTDDWMSDEEMAG